MTSSSQGCEVGWVRDLQRRTRVVGQCPAANSRRSACPVAPGYYAEQLPCTAWMHAAMASVVLWQALLLPAAHGVSRNPGLGPYVDGIGHVMMTPVELQLLFRYLRSARTFFEFGMGASTLHIANNSRHLDMMISVDLDPGPFSGFCFTVAPRLADDSFLRLFHAPRACHKPC